MNIEYLEEFLTLADCKSYNKAARQLHVSQPTLSRHVSALEKELGTKLVDRSCYPVKLTSEGEVARGRFEIILCHANELLSISATPRSLC